MYVLVFSTLLSLLSASPHRPPLRARAHTSATVAAAAADADSRTQPTSRSPTRKERHDVGSSHRLSPIAPSRAAATRRRASTPCARSAARPCMGNSFSGAVAALGPEETAVARAAMKGTRSRPKQSAPIVIDMIEAGFLVDAEANELSRVHNLHATLNDQRSLGVIIMPTEDCNFRCIYCYESFLKKGDEAAGPRRRQGNVRPEDPQARKARAGLVRRRAAVRIRRHARARRARGRRLRALRHRSSARTSRRTRTCSTPPRPTSCSAMNTRNFQITVDGDSVTHDRSRHLNGGGETFDIIWRNLLHLQSCPPTLNGLDPGQRRREELWRRGQLWSSSSPSSSVDDPRFTLDFHSIWNRNDTASERRGAARRPRRR